MQEACQSCCTHCRAKGFISSVGTSTSRNSFSSLFSAGTITLPINSDITFCTHQHAPDGWHTLPDAELLFRYVSESYVSLSNALTFLLRNTFATVTYKAMYSQATLRVYLVPNDRSAAWMRHHQDEQRIKSTRKHLRVVLAHVSRASAVWQGIDTSSGLDFEPFFPPHTDGRSLAQIFSDLSSTGDCGGAAYEIPHLRSQLYDYQKESLATMLRREANMLIDDPLYIQLCDMNGKWFFMQPSTLEVYESCPRIFQTRGGFLCEELGTGKTVMVLALIVASLDDLPRPPEHVPNTVLTPLSLRLFPFHQIEKMSDSTGINWSRKPKFPSLVEILCDYVRMNPDKLDLRSYEDALDDRQLWRPILNNVPFYLRDDSVLKEMSSWRRRQDKRINLRYLSPATLIVVPKTLQAQWASEIMKHCSNSIRTLVIGQKTEIPPPQKLASEYDIVLVRDTRISQLQDIQSPPGIDQNYPCNCPSYSRLRIPDCSCVSVLSALPLLRVHWKRVVRDEGHNAATQSTNLNMILNALSAERKWIVTGTPTRNLLGLSFGSNEENRIVSPSVSPTKRKQVPYEVIEEASSDFLESTFGHCQTGKTESKSDLQHQWNAEDRKDLRKLADMMSSFLGILPFAADTRAFDVLVADGLFAKAGPLPGSVQALEQLMRTYMVRHRIVDIERCVQLPPLHEETVLLDLDDYGRMSYNVILSLIAVNAIDSERKDQDYLFHTSRTNLLAATIVNLSQSLFWRFDEDVFDFELSENIKRAENAILHAQERGQPDEDIRLVEQAIINLRKALHSRSFREMQHELEVPYRVRGASPCMQQAWGIVCESAYDGNAITPFFMFPYYVFALRTALTRQPLTSEVLLVEHGNTVRVNRRILEALNADDSKASSKRSSEKQRLREGAKHERQKMVHERRSVSSKEKLSEMQGEYQRAQERLKAFAEVDEVDRSEHLRAETTSGDSDLPSARDELLQQSPFAAMRIGNSCSSKLNYILKEVLTYAMTEKILIFSKEPFNLQHISEGLDMIGVKYLHFMQERGMDQQRDQWLTTFETSDTYRVFLMELKYGARGLNIVSASRVIFCEPVWHADVESQAIKRVHRIGQTRPVTVKTLAIRSTFEEYMIKRRREPEETGSKSPGLAEESGIRHYLQNPVFLEASTPSEMYLDMSLLQPAMSCRTSGLSQPSGDVEFGEDPVSAAVDRSDVEGEPFDDQPRKRLKVKFG